MTKRRGARGSVHDAASRWPGLNSLIWLHLQVPDPSGGEEVRLPTRVEDRRDDRLLVAAPGFRGDLQVVVPGLPVTVAWTDARGQSRQEFRLSEAVRQDVPVWELAPSGDVVVRQRRRFARVAASGTVVVHPVAADPLVPEDEDAAAPVTGLLVDLSEGGALLNVPDGSWPTLGRLVRVVFEVEGSTVDQVAQVVRSDPAGPGGGGRHEVVIGFVEPVPGADVLRRFVMQTQIRHRRGEDR